MINFMYLLELDLPLFSLKTFGDRSFFFVEVVDTLDCRPLANLYMKLAISLYVFFLYPSKCSVILNFVHDLSLYFLVIYSSFQNTEYM